MHNLGIHAAFHSQLAPDPHQVRRRIAGIESLAGSIKQHGLMQNLVVRYVGRDAQGVDRFLIVGGERRWHAIALLIEGGFWARDQPIPIKVIETDGIWENLAENYNRVDVTAWELGFRFCELLEAGCTQQEIAARLQTTQGRVSRHIQISTGLSPDTIAFLQKTPTRWTMADLLRIAALRLRGSNIEAPEPDTEAQIELAKRIAGMKKDRKVRRKRPSGVKERDAVFRRYQRLRDEKPVSSLQEERILRTFVDYLAGKTRCLKLEI